MAENGRTEQTKVETRAPSGFVTVACKLGVAWIDLQLSEERAVWENTQSGPREVKQYAATGPIHRIRGTAYPRGEAPDDFPEKPRMVLGYALTPNIPREFWDRWVKQHAKAPYVMSGMIYAFESTQDITAKAREMEGVASGMEPLERGKENGVDVVVDKRVPRGISATRAA